MTKTKDNISISRPAPFEGGGMMDDRQYKAIDESYDNKQKKIDFTSIMPSEQDGEEGDIRIGIVHKGHSLIAVKQAGGWMYAKLSKLSDVV